MAVEFGKWQKIEREDSKKNPPAGIFFMKGWWTNHRDEPIKRAIYGQKLRFHIQMNKNFAQVGDIVYFGLYDCDRFAFGKDTVKKDDDPIPLEYKETKKPYEWAKVDKDYKVVLEFRLTTELMANWSKLDQDGVFELYFRCSYNNRGKKEHCALPFDKEDYLRLGTIVIDRYKMPGLNPEGTGIAEDMAYGFGYANPNKQIYTNDEISQYIKEYTERGFDINSHYQFANIENELEGVTVLDKKKYKRNLKEILSDYSHNIQELIERTNKKAIYSKEDIYAIVTEGEKYPSGEDIQYYENESNTFLFERFFNRVDQFFARGELENNINEMIEKFRRNEGGIYENNILTNRIKTHKNTIKYCFLVEDYISEYLKTNFNKLENIEDKEPYFLCDGKLKNSKQVIRKKDFGELSYSYGNLWEATEGLTIALNAIWATEIILKEVSFENEINYRIKYKITLWDHFGLDKPDMTHKFNTHFYVKEIFACWFALQHLRGYRPFITKITFDKEFSGNLNIGGRERKKQREIEEERKRRESEEMERLKKRWEYLLLSH
jgi:hypothetical protein